MKKTKALSISLSVIYAIALVLLAISFSIAFPIYFRPFYYMLIGPFDTVNYVNQWTGKSLNYQDIVNAYNEVLDFCCFYTKFGTGKLAWSQEGMNHFADCRGLFTLDTVVMIVSTLVVGGIHAIKKFIPSIKIAKPVHLISGCVSILIPVVVGSLASINFDKAFETFHKIFFPGKDNWIFDYTQDEIILAMPEEFFAACAILIGVLLLGISTYYIVRGARAISKKKTIVEQWKKNHIWFFFK